MSLSASRLTEPRIASLLDSLFVQAEASSPLSTIGDLSAEERTRLMGSRTGYRDFYSRLKDMPLAVSRETGRLLYMLARSCRARTIVEFGTSFGLSTLHLAAALRDNGGGEVQGRGWRISSSSARATPSRPSASTCPTRSTCCSSTERRVFIRKF
jgi:hypothetical protein